MFQRLTHAAISFAIVVVVHQVYVLVVVPFLEPQWNEQALARSSTGGQHGRGPQRAGDAIRLERPRELDLHPVTRTALSWRPARGRQESKSSERAEGRSEEVCGSRRLTCPLKTSR